MNSRFLWKFPLRRCHTGLLLGNATMGAMIWGEDNVLRITLNRSDFWDHRGGKPWTPAMNYRDICALLEEGDEAGLRRIFEEPENSEGKPKRPTRLPLGRLEIELPQNAVLTEARLHPETGCIVIAARDESTTHSITLHLSMEDSVLLTEFSQTLISIHIREVPAWEILREPFEAMGFVSPELIRSRELSGWVQPRPSDPPICTGYRYRDRRLWVTAQYGATNEAAAEAARARIHECETRGPSDLISRNVQWWSFFWRKTPKLEVPNDRLDFLYRYGLYKFAGMSYPGGLPAGLQGPWVEDHGFPPWSADYHFNINVQMCYWPAYKANHLSHLLPLFDMIHAWMPKLRENARLFIGIDDGILLPHAVDDRGTCMGGFWTGTVDHGCTAWIADMMYRYFTYGGDLAFLRDRAFPFMAGAMRVYEAMLVKDGDKYHLPVSVSPEYRGAAMDAWGANASFQLACIHNLCRSLVEACSVLDLKPNPVWEDILKNLPAASFHGDDGDREIALWDGVLLEESHRHHSHLAGIFPFDIHDLEDADLHPTLERTLRRWTERGMGQWSGWCMSWASMIHSHLGNPDMAELLLMIWEKVFTNEDRSTLHDCVFPGLSLMGSPGFFSQKPSPERMQMDAGMGTTAAILEMFLLSRQGVHHLFRGAPSSWKRTSFTGIRAEGSFLVSASRSQNVVTKVSVRSCRGGTFRLANPWEGSAVVEIKGIRRRIGGKVIELKLAGKETAVLRPAPGGEH